jgi:hypothetical protein
MSEKLVFDGKIAYICPKCGKEQRFVSVWWTVGGCDAVPFTLLHDDIRFSGKSLRSFFNLTLRDVELEDEPFHCPSCHEFLEPENIRKGFWQWLERLKKEDPKKHAEVIALLL